MTHASPTVMLLWTVLCVIELAFLLVHLWKYDRFACLRWNSGRQPGAFKRIMTYSYLLSVPLIFTYSASMAVIKYKQGYMDLTRLGVGVVPKPDLFWPEDLQRWILPTTICFSVAWSLEIVSHLEELTFWLFLLHQGPSQRNWFTSMEYRAFCLGSVLAVSGMPTLTVLMRKDVHKMEAWTFFAGSVGSLLITLWFLVVLFKFPAFLRRVRAEGADAEVVVRLTTFDELNRVRVTFRFIFTIPLLVLAIDGILPGEKHINRSSFWNDLLSTLGGIGCIISSLLTLLIFFPRSIAKEAGYKAKTISVNSSYHTGDVHRPASPSGGTYYDISANRVIASPTSHMSPMNQATPIHTFSNLGAGGHRPAEWEMDDVHRPIDIESTYHIKDDSENYFPGEMKSSVRLPSLQHKPPRPTRPVTPPLHPIIMNYTSPIDLMEQYKHGHRNAGRF